jgi:hemoglobin
MSDAPAFGIPYEALGGEAAVRAITRDFYAIMARDEPALARLHAHDADGNVLPENQERFALFLIGWLGGPQTYMERHGHPRLRMRHGSVPVDTAMRDAWLRCMRAAFDQNAVTGEVRAFLDAKLSDLADFLRNTRG